MKAKSWNETSL
uniref:Uncharacterized protein n=1 Tax=Anguilla anguilla TaxID=7936 RepID=A0A0E9UPH2_ANGAN